MISDIIKVVPKSNKPKLKSEGDHKRRQKDAQSEAGGALVVAKYKSFLKNVKDVDQIASLDGCQFILDKLTSSVRHYNESKAGKRVYFDGPLFFLMVKRDLSTMKSPENKSKAVEKPAPEKGEKLTNGYKPKVPPKMKPRHKASKELQPVNDDKKDVANAITPTKLEEVGPSTG
ncbi:hypothetical protein Cgig2_007512 [Carnegiea gigantea]|uniref:Uncharacterized protein n=1 Tax=Carnegiea gigantea TaxID=171969 RepID=A0A9Q1JTU9_9CARY|nr:hypothetical protein Cgig2_007512 [Carnegiea gigantea]